MQAPIYPKRSGYCQETDTNMVQQCCISHKLLFNRAALHAEEAAEQNWLQCRCIGPTPGVYHKADLTLSLRSGICCTTHPASRPGKQWQSTDCTAAVNPTRSRLTLQAAAEVAQQWPHHLATCPPVGRQLRRRSFLHLALVHSAGNKTKQLYVSHMLIKGSCAAHSSCATRAGNRAKDW